MIEQMTRVAVITSLAEKTSQLGRTSVMKLCYFLQTLRKVPLGYRFSLYSYGPFDSDVLADLDTAATMGGVTSSVVSYYNGYGYRIEKGPRSRQVQSRGAKFLDLYGPDLDWVVENFGSMPAAELELISTLVYSDREAKARKERLSMQDLCSRVRDVKPHFTLDQIGLAAKYLKEKSLLTIS